MILDKNDTKSMRKRYHKYKNDSRCKGSKQICFAVGSIVEHAILKTLNCPSIYYSRNNWNLNDEIHFKQDNFIE